MSDAIAFDMSQPILMIIIFWKKCIAVRINYQVVLWSQTYVFGIARIYRTRQNR